MRDKPVPQPLLDTPQSATLYSLLQQLQASQWWSPVQLRRNQMQELRKLLAYCIVYSPFYRERLRGLDVNKLDWKRFAAIPVLRRSELQAANDGIDCSRLPVSHGTPVETMTSGSTGSPVKLRHSSLTAMLWNGLNLREHIWQQRDASRSAASIRWRGDGIGNTKQGVKLDDWGSPVNLFYSSAPSYYLNSSVDVAAQLAWLRTIQPYYLMTHPSNLVALLHGADDDDAAFAQLLEVRTVGEMINAQLREQVREQLDIPLTDFYSSQEFGYIALQCPRFDHYHVQSESLLVEVLREDGSACEPYENGRLVITSLRNFATPLLRYEIGDYGAFGEKCACGRGLPVLHSIKGRVRNMLRHPDGTAHWPNFGFRQMMDVVPLRQFQLVQHALDAIELKLVVDRKLESDQEQRLRDVLIKSLGYPFQISISYHAVLPRQTGGKFEDFVSLLDKEP